jgi:SAM-dependent methyltransferase
MAVASEVDVRDFWNSHPCGAEMIPVEFHADAEAFFRKYDEHRYRVEPHILDCLDAIDWRGKRVLEIGLGQGADSEQLIRRGAIWHGLDLTDEAVHRVRTRLQLRNLPFSDIRVGSILSPPYDAGQFDIVFSHGVLHHVPDVRSASTQIARLMRPGGELIIMMYAKWSLHYLFTISLYYRAIITAAWLLGRRGGTLGRQFPYIEKLGLLQYLRMRNFLHHNTDFAENPYSKVYDTATLRKDFPDFEVMRSYKRYLTCEPFTITGRGSLLGWHLWAHLRAQPGSRVKGTHS